MKNSLEISKVALKMAMSNRQEEKEMSVYYETKNIKVAAVDVGGKLPQQRTKFIESILVASKRRQVITDCHLHDGAVAGAIREAMGQLENNTNGLSVGGKIAVARYGEHLTVAVFLSIGLLHLNEVVTAIAHRSLPILEKEIWKAD